MAANFNRVILVGNLTSDPELRYTPQQTAVTDLRLAVNTRRGGRNSEARDETLFIDVVVWDRMAENCSEYLSKGRSVLVEGRLKEDSWEDRDGNKRSRIRVVASTVQFLGGRDGGSGGGGGGGRRSQSRSRPADNDAGEAPPFDDSYGGDGGDGGDGGEEIPF